jgi:hypothetical protein
MRTDFGDIRFYDGATELDYRIYSKTDSSTATFFLLIPSINGSSSKDITVYAGNPTLTADEASYSTMCLFYDDAQADGLSSYTLTDIYNSGVNGTLTYDAVNKYYNLSTTANDEVFAKINALDGISDLILETDIYRVTDTGNQQGGLVGRQSASNKYVRGRYVTTTANRLDVTQNLSGSETILDNYSYTLAQSTWFTVIMKISGTTLTTSWFTNTGTLIHTATVSIDSSFTSGNWGLFGAFTNGSSNYFKNIKAYKISSNLTIGDLGDWTQTHVHVPVKGSLYYQSQDLPELEVYPRFGVQLGSNYYE